MIGSNLSRSIGIKDKVWLLVICLSATLLTRHRLVLAWFCLLLVLLSCLLVVCVFACLWFSCLWFVCICLFACFLWLVVAAAAAAAAIADY